MSILKDNLRNFWYRLKGRNYYKKIYSPYYNPLLPLSSDYPEVYNKNGEKMDFYFI